MISTGNDIIALKTINIARTKQKNFYRKIISASEKDLYDRQLSDLLPFDVFVWLLWSVKESVYKYLQRITPELIFSPTRITIDQLVLPVNNFVGQLEGRGFDEDSAYKGIVSFGEHTLHSRSVINEEFIFSVVNGTDNFGHIRWGIQLINSSDPDAQSKSVREFLIKKLSALFPSSDLMVDKSRQGYPIILKDGVEIPLPVSLAHHGHYVGYSIAVLED
ncbi:4'-phosphopantetheinyl transferase family protein [Mucilaginibacter sp. McL0603]|uniref:4'-phosphopantetheinyl transferase family protein n=1 Tax=Mucilaginibacter sp. McL0603 TaxID=3415670 RepID=UPI003CEC004B